MKNKLFNIYLTYNKRYEIIQEEDLRYLPFITRIYEHDDQYIEALRIINNKYLKYAKCDYNEVDILIKEFIARRIDIKYLLGMRKKCRPAEEYIIRIINRRIKDVKNKDRKK